MDLEINLDNIDAGYCSDGILEKVYANYRNEEK
jgi:hypothetical protein